MPDKLTTEQVATLLGWAQSTVRKHAVALGGKRQGARKFFFTDQGVREGVARLGIHSNLSPSDVEQRSGATA